MDTLQCIAPTHSTCFMTRPKLLRFRVAMPQEELVLSQTIALDMK